MEQKLLYKDLSERIIGVAMEVHRVLGLDSLKRYMKTRYV